MYGLAGLLTPMTSQVDFQRAGLSSGWSTTKQSFAAGASYRPSRPVQPLNRPTTRVLAQSGHVAERNQQVSPSKTVPQVEQLTVSAPKKPQSTTKPKAPSRGLTSYLRSLLRYSQVPLASTLDASPASPSDTTLEADGMATVPTAALVQQQQQVPTSTTKQGWRFTSRKRSRQDTSAVELDLQTPALDADHAALALLRERIASGSKINQRTDNFKLGLVVEGGGMRGCVSGGGLQALSDLGIYDAFDAVYGSSAGAINLTYFLSGQKHGVSIYHDHIASPDFIDMKRFWKKRPGQPPALDLDYLIDDVMHDMLPLDWEAVLSSPIPLKVVASSLDALEPVLLQDFTSKEDLVACLKASANVPEIAGGPVHHRGHRLVDAAVFEPIPFRSAIADGCTHVIVLCTRPVHRRGPIDKALGDALETVVKRYVLSPEYMVPAWQAEMESLIKDGISQDDQLLRSFDEDSHQLPWFAGAHVAPIYPAARYSSFSPLCIDVPTLRAGVREGRRAVAATLKASLGGILDFSGIQELHPQVPNAAADVVAPGTSSDSNIVPLTQLSKSITLQRMSKRYDFSHHE